MSIFNTEFYVKSINDIRTRNLYNASYVHGTASAGWAIRQRAEQLKANLGAGMIEGAADEFIINELLALADAVEGLTPDDVPRSVLDPRL